MNYHGDHKSDETSHQGQSGVCRVLRASVGRLGNGYSRLVQLNCCLMLPMGVVGDTLVIPQVLLFKSGNLKRKILYPEDKAKKIKSTLDICFEDKQGEKMVNPFLCFAVFHNTKSVCLYK